MSESRLVRKKEGNGYIRTNLVTEIITCTNENKRAFVVRNGKVLRRLNRICGSNGIN
jgi:hypothetical protein